MRPELVLGIIGLVSMALTVGVVITAAYAILAVF